MEIWEAPQAPPNSARCAEYCALIKGSCALRISVRTIAKLADEKRYPANRQVMLFQIQQTVLRGISRGLQGTQINPHDKELGTPNQLCTTYRVVEISMFSVSSYAVA